MRVAAQYAARLYAAQVCLFTIEYLSRFLTVHAVRRSTVPIGPQVGVSLMPVEGTTDALSWSACFKRVIRFTVDVYVCRCSALGTLWYPQYHRLPRATGKPGRPHMLSRTSTISVAQSSVTVLRCGRDHRCTTLLRLSQRHLDQLRYSK